MPARVLSALARVRPDERTTMAGAFLTLFAFMAGHALLETARDALFLASVPVSQLPWVYLTIAVLALVLTSRTPRLPWRRSSEHELTGWLVIAAIVTLALWASMRWAGQWVFYVLYVWSGVLATLVVVRFWTVLSGQFTVTQAKRLFAPIGTGAVTGAIIGSAVARVLTEALPAHYVVLAAAAVFLAGSLAPRLLAHRGSAFGAAPGAGSDDLSRIARLIWEHPYLRRVAGMILAATVTFTFVDYVFKSSAARLVPDDLLGEFFSSVYLVLNLASLIIQLGAVGWLFRRLGVSAALAIVPALLTASAVLFAAGGGIALAILLKGADGSLRHSLYRTGTELLFVPMSVETRNRVKAFIDVSGQRGGQALASLIILLGLTLTRSETAFAVIAAATAGWWLYLALDLRSHYLNVFRETLSDHGMARTAGLPLLDMASLESALSALSDSDDRKVISALDVLVTQGKVGVIPALILYHPSPAVVVHATKSFVAAGRTDWLPMADRLLTHQNPTVRVAGVWARSVLWPEEAPLRTALRDDAAEVRATALVGLTSGGWMEWENAREEVHRMLAEGSTALALAQAIRYQPAAVFDPVLPILSASSEPAVRLEAIRAMGGLGSTRFIPTLIPMLANRGERPDVQSALVAIGAPALAQLAASLEDPSLEHGVRRHLPGTIAAFASTRAADLLVRHLQAEQDGMIRFKILRSLGRMRRRQPGLPLDHRRLQRALQQTLGTARSFMRWKHALIRHRVADANLYGETLVGLLHDKQLHATERLFRLLNLVTGNDDFWYIYRGLGSDRVDRRAGSRELLEHLVFSPVRETLLELVDDWTGESEIGDGEKVRPLDAVLEELLSSGMETVCSVTSRLIGAEGRTSMCEVLERCQALTPDHAVVLTRAREALSLHLAPSDGNAE